MRRWATGYPHKYARAAADYDPKGQSTWLYFKQHLNKYPMFIVHCADGAKNDDSRKRPEDDSHDECRGKIERVVNVQLEPSFG